MQRGGGWRKALAPAFVGGRMISPRARWLAARTRNAARHGLLIAGSGAIVMIATLLAFVLVPTLVPTPGVALLPRELTTSVLAAVTAVTPL